MTSIGGVCSASATVKWLNCEKIEFIWFNYAFLVMRKLYSLFVRNTIIVSALDVISATDNYLNK